MLHKLCVFVALGSMQLHAPYCHLWPAPLYNIFPHYLINGVICENITEYLMRVLISPTTFV
jgi:hypothetical protein